MKKCFSFYLVLGLGVALGCMFDGVPSRAEAGGGAGGGVEDCATKNGDVNADTVIDLSDAIAMLGSLFNGDPPAAPLCETLTLGPSGLTDTGQSACYGLVGGQWVPVACGEAACAGQDPFYQTGGPPGSRFILNEGGTPEDPSDDTVTDNSTGLVWQRENGSDALPWCEALAYCENLSFAGHDDWRLPNIRELQSIVDYGLVAQTIDPVFGGALRSPYYWTSTSSAERPGVAWIVSFERGDVRRVDKAAGRSVRAVRAEARGGAGGGVEDCATENGDVNADTLVNISDAIAMLGSLFNGDPPALAALCETLVSSGLPDTGQSACYGLVGAEWVPVACGEATCAGQDGFYQTGGLSGGRFIRNDGGTPEDSSDDTVTDNSTGLMWQRDTADVNGDGQTPDDFSDTLPWCEALAYCENLSFAGHDDWRLPNIRELQSIVDHGLFAQSIDPVFSALSSWVENVYWSSTSDVEDPGNGWVVHFHDGSDYQAPKPWAESVRAVRSGP